MGMRGVGVKGRGSVVARVLYSSAARSRSVEFGPLGRVSFSEWPRARETARCTVSGITERLCTLTDAWRWWMACCQCSTANAHAAKMVGASADISGRGSVNLRSSSDSSGVLVSTLSRIVRHVRVSAVRWVRRRVWSGGKRSVEWIATRQSAPPTSTHLAMVKVLITAVVSVRVVESVRAAVAARAKF